MKDNHLMNLLEELDAAAKALQASLLSRDTERIWSDLSRQEQSVETIKTRHPSHTPTPAKAEGCQARC